MASMRPPSETASPFILLDHIHLEYGEVEAIKDISLPIERGEIHAIVGEHGAGKSSLAMIMSGRLRPNGGAIYCAGRRLGPMTPKLALKLGIAMVYQQIEYNLNEYFTVAENLFYASRRFGAFSWRIERDMLVAAKELFATYDFPIDPTATVSSLSLSDQTIVGILKQIHDPPNMLILDEALEKISAQYLDKIIAKLLALRDQGTSIIFITHRVDDIYDFADKTSILRNGELIFSGSVKSIDKISMIRLAYTQMSSRKNPEGANFEFYRFMKYSEAILQRLPVSLVVTDTDYRVKMMNEHFRRYFHIQKSFHEDQPLCEILHGPKEETFECIRAALGSREERVIYDVALSVGDLIVLNNIRAFPVHDGNTLIGHIVITEDVTEYNKLQQQLILSEKLASIGLLAAGVAHEINNPLEIIYNHIRYIKHSFQETGLHDSVDHLEEEVSNIADIVSNLETLSDSKNIAPEEVHLNDSMRKLLELVRHNANYSHVNIEFMPAATDIKVLINKNELKQVLLNLIKNGFEAMPDGGTIFITTDSRCEGQKKIARVKVRDEGPGIPPDALRHIFLPFYSTKKGRGNNRGLGLTISYSIMEKYSGRISAHNVPGGGCEFTVIMPALDE